MCRPFQQGKSPSRSLLHACLRTFMLTFAWSSNKYSPCLRWTRSDAPPRSEVPHTASCCRCCTRSSPPGPCAGGAAAARGHPRCNCPAFIFHIDHQKKRSLKFHVSHLSLPRDVVHGSPRHHHHPGVRAGLGLNVRGGHLRLYREICNILTGLVRPLRSITNSLRMDSLF